MQGSEVIEGSSCLLTKFSVRVASNLEKQKPEECRTDISHALLGTRLMIVKTTPSWEYYAFQQSIGYENICL